MARVAPFGADCSVARSVFVAAAARPPVRGEVGTDPFGTDSGFSGGCLLPHALHLVARRWISLLDLAMKNQAVKNDHEGKRMRIKYDYAKTVAGTLVLASDDMSV